MLPDTESPPPAAGSESVKKKRGRPKKSSASENDGRLAIDVVIATPAVLGGNVIPKVEKMATEKRGRGRPAGSAVKKNVAPKPEMLASGKRGRGRPPGPGKKNVAPKPDKLASGKRGRGRPPGPGKKRTPSFDLLGLKGASALKSPGHGRLRIGGNVKLRIITVAVGEDVADKIFEFSKKGSEAVCVLSANGSISRLTLRHDTVLGEDVHFNGKFQILSLSGTVLSSESGDVRNRSGVLGITLASADGKLLGGTVEGLLVASSPVQIVLGSFVPDEQELQERV